MNSRSIAQDEQNARITNYKSQTEQAPSRHVGCADIAHLTNAYSPEELYPAARKCVDKREYYQAARLFSMAGAYGYFDTLRVNYQAASRAIRYTQILAFQDVGKRKMKKFNAHISSDFAPGTRGHISLCAELIHLGPPAYHPDYMIEHGMRFGLTSAGGAIRADFNIVQAWRQTLIHYLRCRLEE